MDEVQSISPINFKGSLRNTTSIVRKKKSSGWRRVAGVANPYGKDPVLKLFLSKDSNFLALASIAPEAMTRLPANLMCSPFANPLDLGTHKSKSKGHPRMPRCVAGDLGGVIGDYCTVKPVIVQDR